MPPPRGGAASNSVTWSSAASLGAETPPRSPLSVPPAPPPPVRARSGVARWQPPRSGTEAVLESSTPSAKVEVESSLSKLWDDFEVVAEARVFFAEHRIHKLHEFAHVRPEKVSFFEDIVRLIPFAEGDSLKGPSTVLSAWVAAQDTSRDTTTRTAGDRSEDSSTAGRASTLQRDSEGCSSAHGGGHEAPAQGSQCGARARDGWQTAGKKKTKGRGKHTVFDEDDNPVTKGTGGTGARKSTGSCDGEPPWRRDVTTSRDEIVKLLRTRKKRVKSLEDRFTHFVDAVEQSLKPDEKSSSDSDADPAALVEGSPKRQRVLQNEAQDAVEEDLRAWIDGDLDGASDDV